ncbi:hypothetical protein Daus18300_010831 [Diaporthe australafricana]|uniref:Aminoglycoside phosphotransferase domain-containing protein n=1 Tax=Diaporthe australafricana TaxID=127596 RepID=A0ABR3W8Q9_9PEZI
MSSTEGKELLPDQDLVGRLFPEASTAGYSVISSNWEVCTFRVSFELGRTPICYPREVLVRLERKSSSSRLALIATLQKLAALGIPDLVPTIFDIHSIQAHDGSKLEYSVMQFLTGTLTLETVWDHMAESQKASISAAVVEAIQQVQKLRLTDTKVQAALTGTAFMDEHGNQKAVVGGPRLGFYSSMSSLLKSIVQPGDDSPCTFAMNDDGSVIIESCHYPDLGRVEISGSELQVLEQTSILSHNDIEPRNILVRKSSALDKHECTYKLAAIIDWEMASFIPFALETGTKDVFLGRQNQNFDWYRLFKENTASMLLPETHAVNDKLFQALMLTEQASRREAGRNVGMAVQKKWIKREKLKMSGNTGMQQGWIRQADAGTVDPFAEADNEALEIEVLKELGYI